LRRSAIAPLDVATTIQEVEKVNFETESRDVFVMAPTILDPRLVSNRATSDPGLAGSDWARPGQARPGQARSGVGVRTREGGE